jgi:hypothetical protein
LAEEGGREQTISDLKRIFSVISNSAMTNSNSTHHHYGRGRDSVPSATDFKCVLIYLNLSDPIRSSGYSSELVNKATFYTSTEHVFEFLF